MPTNFSFSQVFNGSSSIWTLLTTQDTKTQSFSYPTRCKILKLNGIKSELIPQNMIRNN